MLADALGELYDYNHWATGRVLDAAAGLTSEQWLAPGNAGRGAIRDTLVHLIAVQSRWLAWWDGSLSAEAAYRVSLNPDDFPDLASVRARWAADQAMRAFVHGLSDADLGRVFTNALPNGKVFRLPLWKMMLHVANHGTQHRSEVAAMLTSFGQSPGDLDALVYFRPVGDG